jgi:hypothetical protein
MRLEKLTQESRDSSEYAQQLAESRSHSEITGLHMHTGLFSGESDIMKDILREAG